MELNKVLITIVLIIQVVVLIYLLFVLIKSFKDNNKAQKEIKELNELYKQYILALSSSLKAETKEIEAKKEIKKRGRPKKKVEEK